MAAGRPTAAAAEVWEGGAAVRGRRECEGVTLWGDPWGVQGGVAVRGDWEGGGSEP